MNERIKEFAAQHFYVRNGVIVSPVDGYENIEEELQKFAELILDKCIEVCYNIPDDADIDEHGHITGYAGYRKACLKAFYGACDETLLSTRIRKTK
jgi:hypothetical protein